MSAPSTDYYESITGRARTANYIVWGGRDMRKIGTGKTVYIEHYPSRPRPARKIETESVPGRNGDVIFVQDAWENYDQEYEIAFGTEDLSGTYSWSGQMSLLAHEVAEWLFAPEGYQILYDSYEPETFRLAYFKGPYDVESILNRYGRATITFNCRPERFLFSGEVQTVYSTHNSFTSYNSQYPDGITVGPGQECEAYVKTSDYQVTITNPTKFNARPYFYLYGQKGTADGLLVVQNGTGSNAPKTRIRIAGSADNGATGFYDFMRVDCDTMNVYRSNDDNRNKSVTIETEPNTLPLTFPVLTPGDNIIYWRGSQLAQAGIAIRPRWWTL